MTNNQNFNRVDIDKEIFQKFIDNVPYGLLNLSLPTGFGKTYYMAKYIATELVNNYMNNKVNATKIFVITTSIKNIDAPFNKMKELVTENIKNLIKNGKISKHKNSKNADDIVKKIFENKVLKISSNTDCITKILNDNYNFMEDKIQSDKYIPFEKISDEIFKLKSTYDKYVGKDKNEENTFYSNYKDAEKAFRHKIKKLIFNTYELKNNSVEEKIKKLKKITVGY